MWPLEKAWSRPQSSLVSELLKGHVDVAHPHALPLVGRLPPVLAHGRRLGPRLRPPLLGLLLPRLGLHPLLDGAGPQRVGLVPSLLRPTGAVLGALGNFEAGRGCSLLRRRRGVPAHVGVELPVELQCVAHVGTVEVLQFQTPTQIIASDAS